MRNTVFWIIAIVALLWNSYGIVDVYLTVSRSDFYLENTPPAMQAMIEAMPQWRILLWSLCVFLGVIAALLLIFRRAMAERVFWATAAFMSLGFVLDLALFGGMEGYGGFGIVFSIVLIGIEILFALYARWAARHGLLR